MKRILGISKAGHDKGKIYVIIEETDNAYILADGIYKTISNPKKKNARHIQIVKDFPESVEEILSKDSIGDLEIKRAIKLYRRDTKCLKQM